jgi:hypothetical protein
MSMLDTPNVPSTGEAHDNDDVVVDDTAGGVVLLPDNPARKAALIANVGSANMRVTTDGSDPTATHGKPVVSGASLMLSGAHCPTRPVKGFSADGTTANASEVD